MPNNISCAVRAWPNPILFWTAVLFSGYYKSNEAPPQTDKMYRMI